MNEGLTPAQLNQRDIDRLRSYRELLDFYHGRHWEGHARWGETRLTFNYAKVIIDKITSYLMSGVTLAVDPVTDSADARASAQRAKQALNQVYEGNNLAQLILRPRLTAPSSATAVSRLSGTRRRKGSRLLHPTSRASMPGGWAMIPHGCGAWPLNIT